MATLWEKVEPYLNKDQLSNDAPEDVKEALNEYRKLSKEQMEFALSL